MLKVLTPWHPWVTLRVLLGIEGVTIEVHLYVRGEHSWKVAHDARDVGEDAREVRDVGATYVKVRHLLGGPTPLGEAIARKVELSVLMLLTCCALPGRELILLMKLLLLLLWMLLTLLLLSWLRPYTNVIRFLTLVASLLICPSIAHFELILIIFFSRHSVLVLILLFF